MKIRIKGNTLRLRVSQSEIDVLETDRKVADEIDFGPNKLTYMLHIVDQPKITASFNGFCISVAVPPAVAEPWIKSDQVGIEAEQQVEHPGKLFILVEKDFQCLRSRPGEDEDDLFVNPLA